MKMLKRQGFTVIEVMIFISSVGLLISLFMTRYEHKKQVEKIKENMLVIKTVQDCEQFWQKSLEQQTRSKERYYVPAIFSISNSLLYQNCLKRFEK